MALHEYSKCPYCNYKLGMEVNPINKINIPYAKCPCCKNTYLERRKFEWITLGFLDKWFFIYGGTKLLCSIILGILASVIIWGNQDFNLLETILCSIVIDLLLGSIYLSMPKIRSDINNSITRTQNEYYKEKLKANFRIFSDEKPLLYKLFHW